MPSAATSRFAFRRRRQYDRPSPARPSAKAHRDVGVRGRRNPPPVTLPKLALPDADADRRDADAIGDLVHALARNTDAARADR
jgi:hypothetical protein